MKHNLAEVAQLQPDYLGFIFYDKSPRNASEILVNDDALLSISSTYSSHVGVFVDATIPFILEKIATFNLEVVQLHGEETVEFCERLKEHIGNLKDRPRISIWKVFGIKNHFNFEILEDFEPYVDAFLFDTKGKDKGGNGYTFNWSVLKEYTSHKPIILSGGIGPEHIENLKLLLKTDLPIVAIDVNSKFEDKPGLKNIKKLSKFIIEVANLQERNH